MKIIKTKNFIKKHSYKIISLATILTIILIRLLAEPYRLSGDCMEPAFKDGNLYFLNRIVPYLRPYKVNDVILFKYENKTWIARIVGLENNTIQITDESIVLNNQAFDGTLIDRNWSGWNYGTHAIDKPLQIPAKHVFVLSDNLSAKHDDSRVFGPIPNTCILGLVW